MPFVSLCPFFVRGRGHELLLLLLPPLLYALNHSDRAVNHRPQTDSCVVLSKGNIQIVEESDIFRGGAPTPRERRGLFVALLLYRCNVNDVMFDIHIHIKPKNSESLIRNPFGW